MQFDRSEAGIKNTPLFYRNEYIVYVEGKDDSIFWSEVFPEKDRGKPVKFLAIGGNGAIEKRAQILLNSDLPDDDKKFIIARDSNYSWIALNRNKHPQIVETRYHSIENVMLCKCRIAKTIKFISRVTIFPHARVEKWLKEYDDAVTSLMIADFLNEKQYKRDSIMGNNCSRFCIDNEQPTFDKKKIKDFIRNAGFTKKVLSKPGFNPKYYRPRYYSRAHFYFSAVFKFIRFEAKRLRNGRSVRFSQNALYTIAFEKCTNCMQNNRRIKKLTEEAGTAIENLRNL